MSQENAVTLKGEVTDIFAHRFVITTASGRVLADLGPKGAEQVGLKVGETVELSGEMKPSELKVKQFTRSGQAPITLDTEKPKPKDHKKPDNKHD
ncbi:hypothetical protein P7D22_19085 [Lichenihabitans sp. Uapishka_5]|uniref:hypothetical protein n=1 Tax=Lichenihabitans sp. Uapishka_5 TaxID=3037302 RepID=UPI0029E7F1E5|nr:hypothetical protein [Lichenihabitans sp. Uapishka_5]MDX7953271.1 hypothetical protein [Lichenihabitans sp. Uapishka_5]